MDTAEIVTFPSRGRAMPDVADVVDDEQTPPLAVLDMVENRCLAARLKTQREAGAVSILASVPEGFAIRVIVAEDGYIVCFGNWHTMLASRRQVLEYVEAAITGAVRLKCERLGAKPWRYTVERRASHGAWTEEDVMQFARLQFGRTVSTEYRCNVTADQFKGLRWAEPKVLAEAEH
jgi:hypothetical protein